MFELHPPYEYTPAPTLMPCKQLVALYSDYKATNTDENFTTASHGHDDKKKTHGVSDSENDSNKANDNHKHNNKRQCMMKVDPDRNNQQKFNGSVFLSDSTMPTLHQQMMALGQRINRPCDKQSAWDDQSTECQ